MIALLALLAGAGGDDASPRSLLHAGEAGRARAAALAALRRGATRTDASALCFTAASASHALGDQAESSRLFAASVVLDSGSARAWLNLGETLLFRLMPVDAALAFDGALQALRSSARSGVGPPRLSRPLARAAGVPGRCGGSGALWPAEPCAAALPLPVVPDPSCGGQLPVPCTAFLLLPPRGGAPPPAGTPAARDLALTAASKWVKARAWAAAWRGLGEAEATVHAATASWFARQDVSGPLPVGSRRQDPPVSSADLMGLDPRLGVATSSGLTNNRGMRLDVGGVMAALRGGSGGGGAAWRREGVRAAADCGARWADRLSPRSEHGPWARPQPLGGGSAAHRLRLAGDGSELRAGPVLGRPWWPSPGQRQGAVPLWSLAAIARPGPRTGSCPVTPDDLAASGWPADPRAGRRFRVALLSSDFGVHPVSTLLAAVVAGWRAGPARGGRPEVAAFSLGRSESWWGDVIRATADAFVDLRGRPAAEQAAAVARWRPDAVLELNGHTLGSGLRLAGLGLCPVTVSFLGYAGTTGSAGVTHVLADPVALPAELAGRSFSERLLLLGGGSFFANGFAELQRHVRASRRAGPRASLGHGRLRRASAACPGGLRVVATFSNYQKMDVGALSAWAALLRSRPCSVLWLLRHDGHAAALPALRAELAARGVGPWRVVDTGRVAWIRHVGAKGAADLVLDTRRKNGHTSVADALWAGVPVVTLQGGAFGQRVGASLVRSAGGAGSGSSLAFGVVRSLKEYASVSLRLLGSDGALLGARLRAERAATAGNGLWGAAERAGALAACLRAATESTSAARHIAGRDGSTGVAGAGWPMHVVCGDGRKAALGP